MSNADLIRGGYEAFARQDIPDVRGRLDPGIEWYSPDSLPNGGTYRGHEDVGGLFAKLPGMYEELHVEPEEYLEAGDRVVVLGRHRGRAAGGSFEAEFAHVWTVQDGKATRFHEYADTAAIAKVLG